MTLFFLLMRAAIIGCGLIGRKRAQALAGCKLTVCCDKGASRAEFLALPAGATCARRLSGHGNPQELAEEACHIEMNLLGEA